MPEWGWMNVAFTTPRNGCPEAADTLEVPDGAKENDGGAAAETAEAMGLRESAGETKRWRGYRRGRTRRWHALWDAATPLARIDLQPPCYLRLVGRVGQPVDATDAVPVHTKSLCVECATVMIWALAGATLTRCGRPATVAVAARRRRTSVCALGPWSCIGTGNGADATSARGVMEVTGAWYGSRADGSGVEPSGVV